MSHSKSSRTLTLALGTAFAASMAASNVATAAQSNSNPFAMSELSSGYMQLAQNEMGEKNSEGRCGEGRGQSNKQKNTEGKCGEGKCGGDKEMQKNMEGKCGGDKAKQDGKCGEGKCGSNK